MYSIGIAKKGTLYAEDKRQIDYGMPGTVGNISTVEIGRFPFASDYSHTAQQCIHGDRTNRSKALLILQAPIDRSTWPFSQYRNGRFVLKLDR